MKRLFRKINVCYLCIQTKVHKTRFTIKFYFLNKSIQEFYTTNSKIIFRYNIVGLLINIATNVS